MVAFEDGAAGQVDVLGGERGDVDADATGGHPVLAQVHLDLSLEAAANPYARDPIHGFQSALHLRLRHLPQVHQAGYPGLSLSEGDSHDGVEVGIKPQDQRARSIIR